MATCVSVRTGSKGAVAIADRFPTAPARYAERVAAAVTKLSGDPAELAAALAMLRTLTDEVLAGGRS